MSQPCNHDWVGERCVYCGEPRPDGESAMEIIEADIREAFQKIVDDAFRRDFPEQPPKEPDVRQEFIELLRPKPLFDPPLGPPKEPQ